MRRFDANIWQLDDRIEASLQQTVTGLCRFTGKSSTFFTRLTLGVFIAADIFRVVTRNYSAPDFVIGTLGVAIFLIYAKWILKRLDRLENESAGLNGVLPFPPVFMELTKVFRLYNLPILLIDLLPPIHITQAVTDIFLILHFYIVTLYVPPGQSLYARLKATLANSLTRAEAIFSPA